MHFYITGDTHGNFSRIAAFCRERHTTKEDVLIIQGDVGLNYFLDERDKRLKEKVAALDITLFCIHGNHEARPWEAEGYEEKLWMGRAYMQNPTIRICSLQRTGRSIRCAESVSSRSAALTP